VSGRFAFDVWCPSFNSWQWALSARGFVHNQPLSSKCWLANDFHCFRLFSV